MHLLKSGHSAHEFTLEDRRKAAAVTNEIRRAKREWLEQVRFNRELEQMFARDEARRPLSCRVPLDRRAGVASREPGNRPATQAGEVTALA